jgi:hypothetical protein
MRENCSIQLLDWNKNKKFKYPGDKVESQFSKKIGDLTDKHEDFLEKRAHKAAGTLDQDWDDDDNVNYDAFTDLGPLGYWEIENYIHHITNIDEKTFNKAEKECSMGQTIALKEDNKDSFKLMLNIHMKLNRWAPPELLDSNLVNYTPDKFWKLIQDEFSNSNIAVLSVHLWNDES